MLLALITSAYGQLASITVFCRRSHRETVQWCSLIQSAVSRALDLPRQGKTDERVERSLSGYGIALCTLGNYSGSPLNSVPLTPFHLSLDPLA